jgi:PKHD-type hydroxylase
MVHLLPDLLSPQTTQAARQALEALPPEAWQAGAHTAGHQAAQVKANLQLAALHPLTPSLGAQVMAALDASPAFLSHALPLKVFPPRFNRYDAAHPAFGWHVDKAVRISADGQAVRADLSCTVFLNEPHDYAGGELEFNLGDALHRVKLAAGSAVLYPSGLLHRVTPVTSGLRLASFFWVQSLVGHDVERELLATLDTHLVALRERHGEGKETTALTGLYHRLLRHWSHT